MWVFSIRQLCQLFYSTLTISARRVFGNMTGVGDDEDEEEDDEDLENELGLISDDEKDMMLEEERDVDEKAELSSGDDF